MTPTNLAAKLQIKPDHRVLVLGAPEGYASSLEPLPAGATLATAARGKFDVVHLFVRRGKDLEDNAKKAIGAVREGGVLWISYPKKSSGVDCDLTRDVGWKVVEEAGWGGVAQVSVDSVWSALRFKPEVAVARKPDSVAAPGNRMPSRPRGEPKAALATPEDLAAALAKNDGARATWESMAPSHRKEYVSWLDEAKKPETRARRLTKALEMMTAGVRDRNEKYRT